MLQDAARMQRKDKCGGKEMLSACCFIVHNEQIPSQSN